MAWKDHPVIVACVAVAGVAAFTSSMATIFDSSAVHQIFNKAGSTPPASTPSTPIAPEPSPSKLYAYDATHAAQEGVPAAGKGYKYTAFGCDWRAASLGRLYCSIWIAADGALTMSRVMNRPRLEMADGDPVPADLVELTSDTTGKGYKGKLLSSLDFRDSRSQEMSVAPQPGGSPSLMIISFPTKDVAKARAVLFQLGVADAQKRLSIVPL
jgi:hypothetical protein